jgi:hypothetical protein
MWCARRAVALCVLVACSRTSTPPPPAPRDAAGPRPTGQADLDGDGAADCWRTSGDVLSIQPGCSGPSTDVDVGGIAITLPHPFDTPTWTRAIANVLVGPDHVGCEQPAAGCPRGDPGLRNWIDRRTIGAPAGTWITERYTPLWLDGSPQAPVPTAMILDPAAKRLDAGNDPMPADARLALWDPPKGDLLTIGQCAGWELVAGPAGLAVIEQATSKWSWVRIGTADRPVWFKGGDVQCAGGLILSTGGTGIDTIVVRFTDPRTGAELERPLDQNDFTSWITDGYGRTEYGVLATRDIAAMLAATPDELAAAGGPCPLDRPLLAAPPGPPCKSSGKDDIDGDGKPDCWDISSEGNRDAGNLTWYFNVQFGCAPDGAEWIAVSPHQPVSKREAAPALLAWAAHRLIGAGSAPDPALLWLLERHSSADDHPVKPRWQVGTPALPPTSIAIARDELVLYEPSTPVIAGAAPVLSSSCKAWDVWTSPAGGAVVDRATHKWAWLYLAGADTYMTLSSVQRGSCDDQLVTFELGDGTTVRADPKSGYWELLAAGELEGAAAPGR